MFVASLDKETFVLHYKEEDNPQEEENEKSQRVITLKIYGLCKLSENQKNILVKHTIKSQIPHTIKLITNILYRNNNNILTKGIYNFIFNSKNKKIYRFYIPEETLDYQFLIYLK